MNSSGITMGPPTAFRESVKPSRRGRSEVGSGDHLRGEDIACPAQGQQHWNQWNTHLQSDHCDELETLSKVGCEFSLKCRTIDSE